MAAFGNAHEVLQQLVDESDGDTEALFELSQVEYWIGQLNLDIGNMEEAASGFEAYAEVSAALHAIEPQNADWAMEAAYAQSNLGDLERQKVPSDPEKILGHHRAALELNEEAARLDKTFEAELAESHANVADAWLEVCGLQQSMDHRLKNVELAAEHHRLNPASNLLKQDYAYALSGLSGVQLMTGQVNPALESIRHSRKLMEQLVESDPENMKRNWNRVTRSAREAQFLEFAGFIQESRELSQAAKKDMEDYLSRSSEKRLDYTLEYAVLLRDFAYRSYREAETADANSLLEDATNQISGIAERHPDNKSALIELARTYFYYWEQHAGQLPGNSAVSWLSRISESLNVQGCSQLDIAARISLMTGARDDAAIFVDRLLDKGYRHPEFMRFCAEYGLCSELNVSPRYANPTFH